MIADVPVARELVVSADGVALSVPTEADRRLLAAGGDGAYQVDRDARPLPYPPFGGALIVIDEATGAVLGDVSWHATFYGPSVSCMAWNVGIDLLPSARGRGVGAVAQRLLVGYLFASTDVDRVEASTDVTNLAGQRALERAGFRKEGVARGAQVRGGVRHDLVLYGVLRTDVSG